MGAVNTLFTLEEFERMEDKPGKQELVDGELIELPLPELRHQNISHFIYNFSIYYPDGSSVLVEDGALTTPLIPGFSLRIADVFGA